MMDKIARAQRALLPVEVNVSMYFGSVMRTTKVISLLILFWVSSFGFSDCSTSLTVVVSGELHGIVRPCECPEEPRGGLARRAAVVEGIRSRASVILVDAGGFAGGGMYDSYTQGRHNDSLRTIAAIQGMGAMAYDAVGVGDDDLVFGARWLVKQASEASLPLVNANCRFTDGRLLTRPFIVVRRDSVKIGITSVMTEELLVDRDTTVHVHDPLSALRGIWGDLDSLSDIQIVLSHLGEEYTRVLADSLPECDIWVNGHRKMSSTPVAQTAKGPILQFGFQGRSVAVARACLEDDSVVLRDGRWVEIDGAAGVGDSVLGVVESVLSGSQATQRTQLELYLMGKCPFGLDALRQIFPIVEMFGDVDFHIGFIGTVEENGALTSLHGEEEIGEELVWLAVREHYPQMWRAFLGVMATTKLDGWSVVLEMGLDTSVIASWIRDRGTVALGQEYYRSMRRMVHASPTLLWNNVPVAFELTGARLAAELCATLSEDTPMCDSLPECFTSADCRKKGMVGTCVGKEHSRRCEYTRAVVFDFKMVVPDSSLFVSYAATVATTQELFPGVVIDTIKAGSPEGRRLLGKIKPDALPLYLFSKKVASAKNFPKLEPGVRQIGSWFTFKSHVFRKTYFHTRERVPNNIVCFLDPDFEAASEVLGKVLEFEKRERQVEIRPIAIRVDSEEEGKPSAADEVLRWLVLRAKYPAEYAKYLELHAELGVGFNWRKAVEKLGIEPRAVSDAVKANGQELLRRQREEQQTLEIDAPFVLLIDNQELIVVESAQRLNDILDLLSET